MKKHVISLAVLSAFAVPVFAQSSVTLYGVIDEGLNYTNKVATATGGHSVWEMQSGYAQGSRWGLKGTEDLGGGLKAIFQLENGFDVNTGKLGQGGLEFGRQAYVGLTQDQYGTVTLGRQYDSVVDYLAPLTANGNWGGYLLSHPYDNDNTDNSFRLNNTVKYASPVFAGFQIGGTYSFSNNTGFANNRAYSLGATYALGGLQVAGAYMAIDNPGTNSSGTVTTTDANFIAQKLQVFGGGVNYTYGPVTGGFVYTNSYNQHPTGTTYLTNPATGVNPAPLAIPGNTLNSLRFQNFEINGKYQLTPAFFVGAQYIYTYTNYNSTLGTAHPKYQTFGLMADYNISKRTDFYFQTAYQHVSSGGTGTQLDNAFIPGTDNSSTTSNQVAFRVAIRHKF
ncbi:porin [Trinickia mobilis]|uniref:porin n=1 Tax=Trinickia mobilis TaxID=2816356 RepID=UPI001A8F9176|nr:porin [Trinickia mobilis]